MTNNAIVTLKVVGYDTCIHLGYLHLGMYENLGRKLEHFFDDLAAQPEEDLRFHLDVHGVIAFLQRDGDLFFHSYPISDFAPYRYYIELDIYSDSPITIRYGSIDNHWKRISDNRWEEEPDMVLYNRVKDSEPIYIMKRLTQ